MDERNSIGSSMAIKLELFCCTDSGGALILVSMMGCSSAPSGSFSVTGVRGDILTTSNIMKKTFPTNFTPYLDGDLLSSSMSSLLN